MTYLEIRNRIQELIQKGKVNIVTMLEDNFFITLVAAPDTLKEISECFIKLNDQEAPSAKVFFNKPNENTTRMTIRWKTDNLKDQYWFVKLFSSLKGFTR